MFADNENNLNIKIWKFEFLNVHTNYEQTQYLTGEVILFIPISHRACVRWSKTKRDWYGKIVPLYCMHFISKSHELHVPHAIYATLFRCFVFSVSFLLQSFWHEYIHNLLSFSRFYFCDKLSYKIYLSCAFLLLFLYLIHSLSPLSIFISIKRSSDLRYSQPKETRQKQTNTQNHILQRINPF